MNDIRDGYASGSGSLRLCYVVDDEPAVCRTVSRALRNFGFETESFHDVGSTIAAVGRRMPDLMLLDVALGQSDAVDAIRALSAAGMTGRLYLMSGRDASLIEDVRRIGLRYGLTMGPVLAKPFRIEALKQLLEADLPMAEGHANGAAEAAPAGTTADDKRPIRIDLGEALDRNWVELWYQPKLGLYAGGTVVGAEALARVRHPELGMLFPGSFIPNAKSKDLISLAEHALRAALRDTAEFAAAGHDLQLAVNVPVQALVTLPIGTIVHECRSRHDSDWCGIVLEVTEDEIIKDIQLAHEIATQLRIHRVDLAIDDFGSGYSSLARLKELPFVELKLDRSFVDDCSNDPINAALCKTVVELAHRFGSLAVAEGIERKSDLALLQSIGCDMAQGFLFAHAMPKEFLLAQLLAGSVDFGASIAANDAMNRASA